LDGNVRVKLDTSADMIFGTEQLLLKFRKARSDVAVLLLPLVESAFVGPVARGDTSKPS
jgi:hypothetical protein